MSQISNLYRLQQIDAQLDIARSSLLNIENKLSDDTIVRIAKEHVAQAEEAHQSELKRLQDAENKSTDAHIKIEQSEASLYGGKIQNPKELQDLQNEIESLKRQIKILEDRQLEVMLAVEESESKLSQAKNILIEVLGKQSETNAGLVGERNKFNAQIERLEAERKAALPPISSAELTLYEQLRKIRNGIAVSKVSSRACTACGTTLTAALVQSIQSTGQLIRCPTCGRILYPG